jgi:hypothetical protein
VGHSSAFYFSRNEIILIEMYPSDKTKYLNLVQVIPNTVGKMFMPD